MTTYRKSFLTPEELFQEHLDIGEKLLWTGQPNITVKFTSADGYLIPMSLAMLGFTIFWIFMTFRLHAPVIFPIWGTLFFIVGLYYLFGRFFTKARRKRRTYYAVTSQRVLSLYHGKNARFAETRLRAITQLSKDFRQDGIGTILFGDDGGGFPWRMPANTGLERTREWYAAVRFFDIDNAEDVYRLIRATMQQSA